MLEDLSPSGDITSRIIKINKKIKAKIISNQNCVVGGLNLAKETFKYLDNKIINIAFNLTLLLIIVSLLRILS